MATSYTRGWCTSKRAIVFFIVIVAIQLVDCIPGLSQEQQEWIDTVRFGNVSKTWPSLSQQQLQQLFHNVEQLNNDSWPDNFPYNQAVEVWYSDKNKTTVVRYDDCGDSAAWTGLYLAALSHKYNVTGNARVLGNITAILKEIENMTLCTGKKGYIPRMVGLANDPAYYAYYNGYDDNGHFSCAAPYEDYVWLGHSSRDMYMGIAFGLTNVWHFVNDEKTKRLTQNITESILDDLIKEHFWIVSPKKQLTNPVPGFSAVFRKLALTVNPSKYSTQKRGYEDDFLLLVLSENFVLKDKWASGYYVNELKVETVYILSILETEDQSKVKTLYNGFTKIAVEQADHLQPGFAAFYLSAFPNTTEYKVPRGVLQGGLFDYPSAPDWGRYVDLTNDTQYLPHKNADHSVNAVNVRDRPPDVYQWQRSPTALKGGDTGAVQYPHIDLILPYWMGRSSGHI